MIPRWRKGSRGIKNKEARDCVKLYVHEGVIWWVFGVTKSRILNENVMAAVGMKLKREKGCG